MIVSDLDPGGDVADVSEEGLDQAPLTPPPPTDIATLERLFAEDESEDLDDALATILRVFPSTEKVEPKDPVDDRYRCVRCSDLVVPAPLSLERGWRTVCRLCSGMDARRDGRSGSALLELTAVPMFQFLDVGPTNDDDRH